MKLIYGGAFDGDPESLPKREHLPGAVQFQEAEDMKSLAIIMNVLALVITVAMLALVGFWRYRAVRSGALAEDALADGAGSLVGVLLTLAAMFPHELLHASCFREEVTLYTNLKQGMLFVTGTETMSKGRFVLMSLLPNLVFGAVPFLVFLVMPQWGALGWFGALSLGAGAGDYYNVFNALTQMPRGARAYQYGMHTYWYLPQGE